MWNSAKTHRAGFPQSDAATRAWAGRRRGHRRRGKYTDILAKPDVGVANVKGLRHIAQAFYVYMGAVLHPTARSPVGASAFFQAQRLIELMLVVVRVDLYP